MAHIKDTHIRSGYDLGEAYVQIFPNDSMLAEYWPDGDVDYQDLADNVLFQGPTLGEFNDDGTWVWESENFDADNWTALKEYYARESA